MKSDLLDQLPRPFIIYGMGITGKAITHLLELYGIQHHDIVTYDDKQNSQYSKEEILKSKKGGTLILSPGISLKTVFVQDFLKTGGHLSSELEIAFSFISAEKVISITGSLGKSTTTALIYHGVRNVDVHAFIGGNFGIPLAQYICDLLSGTRKKALYVVLELSSYHLENFRNLKSDISVLTYLSKNHLDRYESLHDYYNTKLTLLHKTVGPTVCNLNGGDLHSYLAPRSFPLLLWTDRHSKLIQKYQLQDAALIGLHNQDNIAMALEVFNCLDLNESACKSIGNFLGLPHRLERLGQFGGIHFINDSKATTIESVQEAVVNVSHSFKASTIIVLLGGRDKGLQWEKLSQLSHDKNLQFCFFGECAEIAKKRSALPGISFETFQDSIDFVLNNSKPGDVVLLSPGGTSLDEFANFEKRGEHFKNEILKHWSC